MKISILLPTRENTQDLMKAIDSLILNAKYKNKIEILLAINNDDLKTKNFLSKINKKKINIKYLFLDKGEGYFDAALRLNKLYEISSGDFLFCFNDDMVIKTKNWDMLLRKSIQKFPKDTFYVMFPAHNQKNKDWPISPIISKKWCNSLGKFSNVFEADTELYILGKLLNRIYKITNIKIYHKGGFKHKFKQKSWRETRWKLINENLKHKKSIFNIHKIFLTLKDYQILKSKIENKIYFFEMLKLIIFFPFYLFIIYKITKINYFKIFIENLKKKKFLSV